MSQLKSPLVSVGVPVHNGEKYLHQALHSLIQQSYQHIEIIISDDYSSDATSSICKSFAVKDPRITYFRQRQKLGMVDNFNFVFQKAKGKYFLWQACDDERHIDAVRILVNLLENNPQAGLAASNCTLFNEKVSFQYSYPFKIRSSSLETLKIFLRRTYTVSSLYYGLYRTLALKNIHGTHTPPFPFLLGSNDTLTIFRIFLNHQLVFSKKVLFFKRDSGYYMQKYDILQKRQFSPDVVRKIVRYSITPFVIAYITYCAILYTHRSALSKKIKTTISIYVIKRYFRENSAYIGRIFIGLLYLTSGLKQKLFGLQKN